MFKTLFFLLVDLFNRKQKDKFNDIPRFHDRENIIRDEIKGSDYGREKENRQE